MPEQRRKQEIEWADALKSNYPENVKYITNRFNKEDTLGIKYNNYDNKIPKERWDLEKQRASKMYEVKNKQGGTFYTTPELDKVSPKFIQKIGNFQLKTFKNKNKK